MYLGTTVATHRHANMFISKFFYPQFWMLEKQDRSCSVIFVDDFAKFIASIKSFFNIDRYKFSTSKFTNDDCLLLLMFLKQLMASEVLCHWFAFVFLSSNLLILCKIWLLILPISDCDGLMSLNDGGFGNPSLWSFKSFCFLQLLDSVILF